MIIFAFQYSSCIHEEGMVTISLHKTKKGAEKAMRLHKKQEHKKWKELYSRENRGIFKFGMHEHWDVVDVEIQE